MTKVYVSATFRDLQECRAAVQLALRRLRVDDVAMESYVAEDRRPLERCLADVSECDVYVGIFAWRYGFVPAGYDKSITELEYRRALADGKHCLIFLLDEDAPGRAAPSTGAWTPTGSSPCGPSWPPGTPAASSPTRPTSPPG
ncbi:DUF4062 domain-containing protein [Micromonospora zhanjiangensis]